jgi:hypothetical protein
MVKGSPVDFGGGCRELKDSGEVACAKGDAGEEAG